MSVTRLVVATGLLLSATSAALAQERQCFGDRPYYGSESAGWLDSNYHRGIDCDIGGRPPVRIPADKVSVATDSRRRCILAR
jgi:hypothetical protein